MRAITGAAHGARAMVKGHYRLIDQPADSAVTVGNILAPHREQTLRRMQAHDTVLCIQDGTRLNFTRRGQTQGLGAIGSNQTGAVARGLELHTTLAVNPDGVALGVLRAAFDAPAPPNPEAEGEPTPKPREERKSFRWIEGLRDCAQAAEQLSQGRIPDFPVTRSHPPASWPSAANSSICRTYRKTAGEESRRRSPVANRWMRP